MSPKPTEYQTFKYDASPFFFYIDVLPLDLSQYEISHHADLLKQVRSNPIMPIPIMVDRVFNGKSTVLIRPTNPISFTVNEKIAIVNPQPFLQSGIKKLLYFTEVRASGEFAISLTFKNAESWWNSTKFLYGRLRSLEEEHTALPLGTTAYAQAL